MARLFRKVLGVAIAILGIFFAIAGGYLAFLGGSLYYVIAGIALIASGALIVRDDDRGLSLYFVVWMATVLWAIYEVGFDGLQLMPRVIAPTVLLVLVVVAGWRKPQPTRFGRALPALCAGVALLGVVALIFQGQSDTLAAPTVATADPRLSPPTHENDGDWRDYGGTLSGRRYSSLGDITPANVNNLELAWVQRTGDLPSKDEVENHTREIHAEATPIHIGNRLFTCTPHNSVQAIDDTTGKTLWKWQNQAEREINGYLVCRGVSYYEAPAGTPCPRRIFTPTYDGYIIALDADTGRVCTAFGNNGKVDLHEGMGNRSIKEQISTSAPTLVNNRLIIGERVSDNVDANIQSGVVRAYDPVTGDQAWAWDVGRSADAIQGKLPAGQVYTPGTPNVWGAITADAANGLVFLGTGNASPDYYIAQRRPFDDRFGTSIVALDVATGRLRWMRQLVHRDSWDMDIPIGPSLFDHRMPDGRVVPALIQTTKMGQLYFLNRLTGEPISPVVERPVRTSGGLPGQRLSPTQPYSVGMPSLTPAAPTEVKTWGATPIDQLMCRIQYREAAGAGPYVPIGLKPVIGHPAFNGINDWGGAAVDPQRGIMTINTMEVPFRIWLARRDTKEGQERLKEARPGENALNTLVGPQRNTPYIAMVKAWVGIFGAPCLAPPWGRMTAIDLNSRKVMWSKVLGTARDTGLFSTQVGPPLKIGVPNIGGSILTAGGISFIGATTDQYLRAFDAHTGKELWKARLPAGPQATPMTYRGKDGRQYVVITAGGHGAMGTRFGDYTMAFALPKSE